MTKLAVLIPTHKLDFSDNEKKSLDKLLESFNKEHIYVVLPEKTKINKKKYDLNYIYFEDYYFTICNIRFNLIYWRGGRVV